MCFNNVVVGHEGKLYCFCPFFFEWLTRRGCWCWGSTCPGSWVRDKSLLWKQFFFLLLGRWCREMNLGEIVGRLCTVPQSKIWTPLAPVSESGNKGNCPSSNISRSKVWDPTWFYPLKGIYLKHSLSGAFWYWPLIPQLWAFNSS